jgi:hypothetical protein
MSTAGYLQDAKNQQKRLAETITAKGITATATEKYKDLVDKVAQIENLKGEERTLENFTNALSEPKSVVQLKYPDNIPKTLNAKLGSKNLFDETAIVNTTVIGLTMSTNSDGSHKLTGTLAGQRFEYFNKVKLSQIIPQGTTVTVGGWYDVTPTDNYIGLVGYGSDNKILFQANAKASSEHLTTTLTADLVSVGIVVRCVASAIGDTVTFDNIKLQLELGSTATPYTPFISDFSTVNVTRCGKNLFDINNPTYAALSKANTAFLPTIEDGVISFNTYYSQRGGSGFVIPVEPDTTITISFDSVGSDYWTEIMAVESILDNVAINIYKYPQFKNITKYTLTQQAGKHYILFILDGVNGYYTAKIKNLQIEKGATATPYEPYQGQTYTSTPTGEVTGITNLYPITTLLTDNAGVVFEQVTGGFYKEILPSTDKNGITKVYQPSVDSSIDSNIKPENIKKGVKILGILGTYDGN